MNTGTDYILALLGGAAIQVAVALGVAASIFVIVFLFRLARMQSRIKRYLLDRGYRRARLQWRRWHRLEATVELHGEEEQFTFQMVRGGHLHKDQSGVSSTLIFFHTKGSITESVMPNRNLVRGFFPHMALMPRLNVVSCILAATIAGAGALLLSTCFFYQTSQVTLDLPNFSKRTTLMYNGIASVILALNVLATILVTLLATKSAYRCARRRRIYNDGPLCTICLYDLRENTSNTCPECAGDTKKYSTLSLETLA